jgi:RNA polymerase sigma-32 factor
MNVDGIHADHSGSIARTPIRGRSALAPAARPSGSSYLGDIRRFPILERETEYQLAKRWREHGDRKAADQIITSHLRLAAKIATGYRGYGLPLAEIVSEGNVGLMKALDRFEPDKGYRFATYAVWWIRASIQDYVLRSWSIVKIGSTTAQRRLFFKLRTAKAKIMALDNSDLHPEQLRLIATTLGVTDQDVVDMNRRMGGDASLNASIRHEENSGEWIDHLADEAPSPEAIVVEQNEMDHRRKVLRRAIGLLNDRERRIFEARHLIDKPKTFENLAAELNVSCERIRQIEAQAFRKVQTCARASSGRA